MSKATNWVNQNKDALKDLSNVKKNNPRYVVDGNVIANVNETGDLWVCSTTIQNKHIISLARWMISTFSDIHEVEK